MELIKVKLKILEHVEGRVENFEKERKKNNISISGMRIVTQNEQIIKEVKEFINKFWKLK